jgi:hypothetical protein
MRLGRSLLRSLVMGIVMAACLALGMYAANWWGFGIVPVVRAYASGQAQVRWLERVSSRPS